jgi:hypothetical protein
VTSLCHRAVPAPLLLQYRLTAAQSVGPRWETVVLRDIGRAGDAGAVRSSNSRTNSMNLSGAASEGLIHREPSATWPGAFVSVSRDRRYQPPPAGGPPSSPVNLLKSRKFSLAVILRSRDSRRLSRRRCRHRWIADISIAGLVHRPYADIRIGVSRGAQPLLALAANAPPVA